MTTEASTPERRAETAQRAIAKIFHRDVGGAGVLIPGGYILTCWHVLHNVFRSRGAELRAGAELEVCFPCVDDRPYPATVTALAPKCDFTKRRADEPSDLALLRLDQKLARPIRPITLAMHNPVKGMVFTTWGFPQGLGAMTPAYGILDGEDSGGWLHAQKIDSTGPFVLQGYSGAPVFGGRFENFEGDSFYGICAAELSGPTALGRVISRAQIIQWLRKYVSPYPGTEPFDTTLSSYYHGPEEFVQDLCDHAFDQGLVVLMGQKGSGKTSLLQAGLAPGRIRARFSRTFYIMPGPFNMDARTQCGKALGRDWSPTTPSRVIRNDIAHVVQSGHGALLIFDSFDAFLEATEVGSSKEFFKLICGLALERSIGDNRLGVILVVDEGKRIMLGKILSGMVAPANAIAMPEFGYLELRRAISHPAKALGVDIPPNLVRRILNEYRWERANIGDLSRSLALMWAASGGEPVLERDFLGFGIEKSLSHEETAEDRHRVKEELLLRHRLTALIDHRRDDNPEIDCDPSMLEELIAVAEKAEPVFTSPQRARGLLAIEERRADFRNALEMCLARPEHLGHGIRLGGALIWYWNLMALFSEGRQYIGRLLAASEIEQKWNASPGFAKLLYGAGTLAFLSGDMRVARKHLLRAAKLWRNLLRNQQTSSPEIRRQFAFTLIVLGRADANLSRARRYEQVAVDLMGAGNDSWGLALALNDLGYVVAAQGDYTRASDYFGRSITLWRAQKDFWGLPLTLVNYGAHALEGGQYELAHRALQEALRLHTGIGDQWEVPNSIRYLAELDLRQGDAASAMEGYRQSIQLSEELGRSQLVADGLLGLARSAFALSPRKNAILATRLLSIWRSETTRRHFPMTLAQTRSAEQLQIELEEHLGVARVSDEVERAVRDGGQVVVSEALDSEALA